MFMPILAASCSVQAGSARCGRAMRAQIGAAGGDDRVGVIGFRDRADRHGGDADLVADLVGEGGLEQPAVDRLFRLPDLAGGAVDQSAPATLNIAREDRRVLRRVAAIGPVVTRHAHRYRPVRRPDRADGAEDFERIARRGSRASRHIRRCAGWSAARGSSKADSRARNAARARRSRPSTPRRAAAHEIRLHPLHVCARHLPRHGCRSTDTAPPRPRSPASCPRRAAGRCLPTRPGSSPCGRHDRAAVRPWPAWSRGRNRRCASRRAPARRSTGRDSRA